MTIDLIRRKISGKAVTGRIMLPFDTGALTYDTLENADFLIPNGTYPLQMTWSPRFKKMMPLIDEVPEREGIRIHKGSVPEHSEGCVLVNAEALDNIKIFINAFKKWNEDEPLNIRISTAG